MIYELRRYGLVPHNKAHFYERFEKQFLPIAEQYGLDFIGAWDSAERNETVYLLRWPDEQTMKTTWERVLADQQWIHIKRVSKEQFGDLVRQTHSELLNPTAYSGLQ